MAQFGHVVEIHPVDPGNRGRHRENCGVSGQLPGHVALAVLFEQGGGFDDAGQRFAQAFHSHHRALDVIEHIAEPDPRAGIDHRQFGRRQPFAHFDHRADHPHEPAELAPQPENPADRRRFGEDVDRPFLEHLHAFLQPFDHRQIAIDDEIEDRVRGVVGPFGEPFGHAFQPRPQIIVRAGRANPYRHQEIAAKEDRGLPVADVLALFDRRGARDDEEVLAVDLDFGDLLGVDRILDRQRVQAELGAHQLDFLGRRIVQPDPVELRALRQHMLQPVDDERFLLGFSAGIAAGGNDRHRLHVAK